MSMPWERFCFVHHVAPLHLQWPLAQLFPAASEGSLGQYSVYLSFMSMRWRPFRFNGQFIDIKWVTCSVFPGWLIHIEGLQNRLLKDCNVPATSAGLPRVSFFFSFLFLLLRPLTGLMKQTRHAVCTIRQSIFLDVYGLIPSVWLSRNVFFLSVRVEPEQPARATKFSSSVDRHGHIGDEDTLAVRRYVLLHVLLAHRGPLDPVHQLPPLGRAQNLVCFWKETLKRGAQKLMEES